VIAEYIRALWRHWVAAVTGGSITAVFTALAITGHLISPTVGVAFLIGAWLSSSFRAWADLYSRLRVLEARAPRLRIDNVQTSPSGFHGEFAVLVHLDNPGERVTFQGDWALDVTKAGGETVTGIRGKEFGPPARVEEGAQYDSHLVFKYGGALPDPDSLAGAKYDLSVTDIRNNRLRATYP